LKTEKIAFLIPFLFLAIMIILPIANYSTSSQESIANDAPETSGLSADYIIYENETKFYAVNDKLQQVEFESENFSELINNVNGFYYYVFTFSGNMYTSFASYVPA